MYISIKYKYIAIYSMLTILPIIMFHIWVYQMWSEKLHDTIVDSNSKLVSQLSNSIALIAAVKNRDIVSDLIDNSGLDKQSKILVMDHSGELIYTSNKILAHSDIKSTVLSKSGRDGHFVTRDYEEEMLVTYYSHPVSRWHMVVLTPTAVIYEQLSSVQRLMIVLILFSFVLSIASVVLISFHLTRPIRTLRKKLEGLEHGRMDPLDEQEVVAKDEIWKIGSSFNAIVNNLRDQMNLHYQLKMKSDQARLFALQSQINPHFLHNTLETINSIALIENVPIIAELSRALSKMFRYNTMQAGGFVTFKEELEQAENYLNVQLIRFDGIITSQMDIDKKILEKQSIKFILQPLIENCFIHGFKDLDEQGRIIIRGCMEDDKITISIEDNGVGMDNDQLARINEKLDCVVIEEEASGQGPKGVGLLNVNSRVKITFGNTYGLSCHALLPRGLSVKITFPAVMHKEG
ncbi:sensor histidine kinase [Paenibacillus xerothermodurans]|uniref:Sensor histidine kinase n=1 Tax=Paenibacillus xerothermodurans TaxID=1977292 RepID=A0A2W1NGF6_PAEXE|nr:histidine kinase [Paenibacillus xerothermodurans]PZE22161.1 sensor histidine kinase [Paenibacillus xerothermodurans]